MADSAIDHGRGRGHVGHRAGRGLHERERARHARRRPASQRCRSIASRAGHRLLAGRVGRDAGLRRVPQRGQPSSSARCTSSTSTPACVTKAKAHVAGAHASPARQLQRGASSVLQAFAQVPGHPHLLRARHVHGPQPGAPLPPRSARWTRPRSRRSTRRTRPRAVRSLSPALPLLRAGHLHRAPHVRGRGGAAAWSRATPTRTSRRTSRCPARCSRSALERQRRGGAWWAPPRTSSASSRRRCAPSSTRAAVSRRPCSSCWAPRPA
jgi:hypothetical protein